MTNLTVITGGKGGGNSRTENDNSIVVTELEKWVQRARERKVVSFVIGAVAADGSVLTQFSPANPDDIFKLHAAGMHAAMRVWKEKIDE